MEQKTFGEILKEFDERGPIRDFSAKMDRHMHIQELRRQILQNDKLQAEINLLMASLSCAKK